jgi:hypothetical protein
LRSCQLCSYSGTSQHFMEPESSLPCSQEPSTRPYPEPDRSSIPSHPTYFNIFHPHTYLGVNNEDHSQKPVALVFRVDPEYGGSIYLRNTNTILPAYTVTYNRRECSSKSAVRTPNLTLYTRFYTQAYSIFVFEVTLMNCRT